LAVYFVNITFRIYSFHREEQQMLQQKLAEMEKKILVGGENLLEKAEAQERMLEDSAKELEERKKKEEQLRKTLEEREVSDVIVVPQFSFSILLKVH